MSSGREAGMGEMLWSECMETKVSSPWTKASAHAQGFAGTTEQTEAAHQSRAPRTLPLYLRPSWQQVPKRHARGIMLPPLLLVLPSVLLCVFPGLGAFVYINSST